MKRIPIIAALAAVALLSVSCYDDSALSDKVSALESRVTSLEAKVNSNASSIQSLVDASKGTDSVTGFSELADKSGYVITFSSGKSITIYHGKDGSEPRISVKQDTDGVWYWTVDGEYVTSGGKKIKAEGTDAITPKFKIENNYWYVSYDSGKTWDKLGKAKEDDSVTVVSIETSGSNVIVTLGDGTKLTLPVASDSVVSKIESVTFVPAFADGAARIYKTDGHYVGDLVFEVLPEEALASLSSSSAVTYAEKAIYTQTKAEVGDAAAVTVTKAAVKGGNLVVSVQVTDPDPAFLSDNLGMNSSLRITDGIKTYAGEYVRLVYGGEKTISRNFDPGNIVLSLGVISDVHINNTAVVTQKFANALEQLKKKAASQDSDGIDGVLVVGDLIDRPSDSYLSTFKSTYEAACDPSKVPMIYTIGNHDASSSTRWYSSMVSDVAYIRSGLGASYFTTDQDAEAGTSMECRHCVIGDYNVLAISPNGTSPVTYDSAALTWLEAKLKAITTADPDRYVIVLTHPMIYDTVYGSLLGEASGDWSVSSTGFWATHSLSSILEKYPQAVVFGGHLHFPLNDPRSVWQGQFTAFGCASTRYMAIENGAYENKATATTMTDKDEFSQGNLLQFDVNGNMRVCRMDFYHDAVIGDPITTSYPVEDGSHLQKYSQSSRRMNNSAPRTPVAQITTASSGETSITFSADDDEFVHDYTVTLTKADGTSLYSTRILTDFYKHAQVSEMAKEYTRTVGDIGTGDFILTVTAKDSWDAQTTLKKEFTIGAPTEFWTSDAAGTRSVSAGSGSVSSDWLSYENGTVSWTANATGAPRTASITLPSGTTCKVTQLSAADFKGNWTLCSKLFDPNKTIGTGNVASKQTAVTFGDPLTSATLKDDSGTAHTNNIGIKGLYKNSTLDASVEIDYDAQSVKLGVFMDRRSAQKADETNYCVYIPECATTNSWSNYVFAPTDFSSNNYEWIWFSPADDTFKTFRWVYKGSSRKLNSKYYICGISIVKATSAEATSIGSSYDVIYQANYGSSDAAGMYFSKD